MLRDERALLISREAAWTMGQEANAGRWVRFVRNFETSEVGPVVSDICQDSHNQSINGTY